MGLQAGVPRIKGPDSYLRIPRLQIAISFVRFCLSLKVRFKMR